jgi:RNA polymerase sigma-70 factor, ECF subfamily
MSTDRNNQPHVCFKAAPGHSSGVHLNPPDCHKPSDDEVSHLSEDVLVSAAQTGHDWAFGELCHRHSKRIFFALYRITKNREDAEDALQESMLKAYVHLGDFKRNAAFASWLTRIGINSALMILRKKRARPETSMEIYDGEASRFLEVTDQTENVEELFARRESIQRLKRAIRRLKPRLRKVVEIHQLNDMSVKEIADLAGISEGATKSRLFHARISLRKALQRKSIPAPQRTPPRLSITPPHEVESVAPHSSATSREHASSISRNRNSTEATA